MKLKNVTIRTQLQVGMGIIVLLVMVLAAVVWEQSKQLSLQTQKLYNHPLTVRRALHEISTDILLMHRDMKDVILSENNQERLPLYQSIASREAEADRQFEVLFDRYLGPRSDIEVFHDSFVQWKVIRDETIRLLQAGNVAEATKRTRADGVGGGHVEKMWKQLETVSDFAQARANQFYQDAEELESRLNRHLAFVATSVVLLSLLISWFLLRNIRKPMMELSGAIERFRRGDLHARSHEVSTNEFGRLSTGFNALAETIQIELQSREATARIAEAMLREEEVHAFCRELLKRLMTQTGSQLGAVYLLNEQKTTYDHFESIGLTSVGRTSFSATEPEGEFGSALATGEIRHLANIPENVRFTFATTSGEFFPREIITIPIAGNKGVVAVISLASIHSYSMSAIRLVNDVWTLVVARLNGILAAERIRLFAERIERQNEELQAQQEELEAQDEELRDQAEELRKQTEEVQGQNVELERQQRAVEEVSRLKSQFLSNMSHELRTPLNSVMALSRVLMMQARTKLSEEEVGYLEIIERNGRNLLRLINEILDLAKIEAGRMEVHPKVFSLGQTLENMVESILPLAKEKQIELRQEIPEGLPPLESDELRVSQILQNLIGNAVKFTDVGRVCVSVRSESDTIVVVIEDTGIGISASDLPHIFDEFRQADGTSTRRHEGTGLGLAIARKTVQMLGGEIAVTSTLGQGSTFTLTLPLAWQNPSILPKTRVVQPLAVETSECKSLSHVDHAASWQQTEAGTSSVQSRILLVEDNEAAIIQVKTVLESAGHAVHIARGGQEAIDYVSHTIPDGIILDLMMPGIDGFAVLEKIRGTSITSQIPVLILTAKDLTPDDLKRLSANHVQQLVQKGDVDRETLLIKIKTMVAGESGTVHPRESIPVRQPATDHSLRATILIVEDNPDNMVTIKAVLQNRYRLLEATDGVAGLDLAVQYKPSLILLDMALPKMDGLAVIRHLKGTQALASIPVIAMTARVMKGDREEILATGCDDYIAKPINPADCLRQIDQWINQ